MAEIFVVFDASYKLSRGLSSFVSALKIIRLICLSFWEEKSFHMDLFSTRILVIFVLVHG